MTSRLIIAGTHSGVGKTTLAAGLIAALRQRGLTVQPFKVGPDYIDPSYHTLAAGRPCRNLDTWLVPPDRVRTLFACNSRSADIAVIEGVMGLYDGVGYEEETASTSQVAKLLQAPVVLVLDASKLARSAGAIALGYRRYDESVPLAGFILNRTGSDNHGRGVAAAVTRATGLPVLGWLPRTERLQVPERHLGLVPTKEPGPWAEFLDAARDLVTRHLDLEALLAIAEHAPLLSQPEAQARQPLACASGWNPEPCVIAVARDEAFHFIYEDNLDLLREAGAQIAFFSPLRDEALPPQTAGIILSGGFPEVFAGPLAANRKMHEALQEAHRRDIPIYAECGGLMYLTEAIIDLDGRSHTLVGLLAGRTVMSKRLNLGYRVARSTGNGWFLRQGETVRGHEFHYSRWEGRPGELPPAYYLSSPSRGQEEWPEGACRGNLWASYVHLHLGTKPELAEQFVAACRPILVGKHGAEVAGGVRT